MPLKPAYQTENYVKKIKEITSRSVVECRFPLGAGVSEVLAVSPQLSPAGCEVTSGRVNYGGRLVCTAVFADMNGGIGRAQKGAEFTHFADDECLAPAQTAVAELSCEKCTVRRDGSSYLVTAVISARISVYGNAERTYLSEADGAVCRFEQVKMLSAITFSGESEVEDEFDAAGVEDILMHSARPVVTDCRCGAGEIRIAGEIYLSLLAVRGEELVALDRVIPYTAEILCDDAVLPRRAVCRAQLRDCALSAKVNEDRGRCLVDFSATLCFDGDFCEEHEVSAVTDAFMTDGEVLLLSTDTRMLIVHSGLIPAKVTKDSQGVSVMALKKKHTLRTLRRYDGSFADPKRYQVHTLPGAGALPRDGDGSEQLTLA